MNRRKAVSNFMFAIIIVCFAAKSLKSFDSFLCFDIIVFQAKGRTVPKAKAREWRSRRVKSIIINTLCGQC